MKKSDSAITELEHKQKEIESLHDGFLKLDFSKATGEEIKEIKLFYTHGNPARHYSFIFKKIDEIHKNRKPQVEKKDSLCSCGSNTHKRSVGTAKKPIHCTCTIAYIKSLQDYYRNSHDKEKEITSKQLEINALLEGKKNNLENIRKEHQERIRLIEKEYPISDEKIKEIKKETDIIQKITLLADLLKEPTFKEQTIPDIIVIKTRPPAFNPIVDEKNNNEEDGPESQPGLLAVPSRKIPVLQLSSDFKKSKKLLNKILEQARRVHYDDSRLRHNGTPKAFNILKALACCIIEMEIESPVNADDEIIYEKLKSACSLEGPEHKNGNAPMTIHHALKEPRRSVFACCSLFGSPKAEQVIQKTIYEIDNPIYHAADTPTLGRHAFGFLPCYGRRR